MGLLHHPPTHEKKKDTQSSTARDHQSMHALDTQYSRYYTCKHAIVHTVSHAATDLRHTTVQYTYIYTLKN